MNVWLAPDAEEAAELATAMITGLYSFRDLVRLGVPGGRTPGRIFQLLSQWKPHMKLTEIYFADERAVPLDDPESNYRLVHETLIAPLGPDAPRVFPMRADRDDLEAAAREYESHFDAQLTVLLLGVGEDGHIASLFPHSPLLDEQERRVMPVWDSPKPPARRLTITPRVIRRAELVLVVATGAMKAAAVARALAEEGELRECPARLVREATWVVDEEAAADLDSATLRRP